MRLVDLAEHRDDAALALFYHEVIVPAFPNPDELDDLEDWQMGLSKQRRGGGNAGGDAVENAAAGAADDPCSEGQHPLDPELHVVIALEDDAGAKNNSVPLAPLSATAQLGGAVYEWYPGPQGGTALLSYLVTSPHHRRRGVAATLVAHLTAVLSRQGVRVLIAETHKMLIDDGTSMDPKQRHIAFHRLGFAPVQLCYAQPPVRVENAHSDDLLLIAHCGLLMSTGVSQRVSPFAGGPGGGGVRGGSKDGDDNEATSSPPSPRKDATDPSILDPSIPSEMLQSYIDGFCGSVFGFDDSHLFENTAWYLGMAKQLDATPRVRVLHALPPPWDDSAVCVRCEK